MSPKQISMLERRFTCVRLSHSYLTRSLPRLLTMTFTTAVLGRSSSWRFGASSYKAAPKGPPSSLVQHDADRTSVFMTQRQSLHSKSGSASRYHSFEATFLGHAQQRQ